MLSGYKTYITAAVTIIGAVGAYLSGEVSLVDTVQLVVTGLIGAFLKNGMAAK